MNNLEQVDLLIVQHDTVMLPASALYPHPLNRPATGVSREHVDTLKAMIQQSGYNASKPLTVRQWEAGHQIIEGHHRWHAATELGYTDLPCVIEDLDDSEASLRLLTGNQQTGNDPLDIGLTALATVVKQRGVKTEMSVTAFAERLGKSKASISEAILAARVHQKLFTQVNNFDPTGRFKIMAEIGGAPEWLWCALGQAAMDGKWTKETARQMVGNYKQAPEPPKWCDQDKVALALLTGKLSIAELTRMYEYPDRARVTDVDLKAGMYAQLNDQRPSAMSDVQVIVNHWIAMQEQRLAKQRQAEAEAQRATEAAKQRVERLRKNCSLDEWHSLSPDEQQLLLVPVRGAGGSFNAQKNEAIEWAQWSWNPVTGCKHDCPYCYARDIALGARMQQASLYPNGWEPTLRSNSLGAPESMRVPAQAQTDTRYRNVFTCSMADLFGRWVPASWIDAVMATVRDSPEWNFLFLTKFPQRLAECDIPDNAWMGTTVDLQARVASAEKAFSKMGGKIKWLSVEPMLEPLHFDNLALFDWVVIGGSSKSEQTPEWHPPYRWIESLVRQCDDAKVPVYMKTNLGIANRLLQLPFNAPLVQPPQVAPEVFHYLGKKSDKAS